MCINLMPMKLKKCTFPCGLVAIVLFFASTGLLAQTLQYERITSSCTFDTAADIHIQALEDAIIDDAVVNITSPDAWIFFDNVKPNEVATRYAAHIQIDGETLIAGTNARVVLHRHGAIIIPHAGDYTPLKAYSEPGFEGEEASYRCNYYYSDYPPINAPDSLCRSMLLDNAIHSLKLKRGYMATLACEADGMGYSRIYIADTSDIELRVLPRELDGKISYIRVMRWQYPSKKGWVGSYWKEITKELQYVEEQCDKTNSTWFYNWGSSATSTRNSNTDSPYLNQEFVPMKWGAGGSWRKLYALEDVTHILGYNEPDHTEQSDVSVEQAIEEWPLMQQTGLRLGSPATTDFTWLYNFMSEANRRNYRVDYVAIHAYWGGLSPYEWYIRLKEIHDRTKRPLWITEWNNGANWTKEDWPLGTEKQQQKQLNDIKGILEVMDTCSFVERYSIYNWVEDKRYILTPNGGLTPAGEYYRDNTPVYFFNQYKEVIPTWKVRQPPTLSYSGYTDDGQVILHWDDKNGEQITKYFIEESRDGGHSYHVVDSMAISILQAEVPLTVNSSDTLGVCFRIVSVGLDGTTLSSEPIKIAVIDSGNQEVIDAESLITGNWQLTMLSEPFISSPAVLTGIPTYRNKMPLSLRVRNVKPRTFDAKLYSWEYQHTPKLANPDTLAYLILPYGSYTWGGVKAEAGKALVGNSSCTEIVFAEPFNEVPVVIANQVTDNDMAATAVRVFDVTCKGFKVKLQYEAKATPSEGDETIHYLAATTGTGLLGDKEIRVGRTPDYVVTDNLDGGYTIGFGISYANLPHVFGAMQTMNDTITSTLRMKSRSVSSATIIKDREKSASHSRVTPEQMGWIVIGHTRTSPVLNLSNQECLFDEPIHDSSGKAVYVNNTEKHSVYIVGGNHKGIKLLKK